MRNRSMADPLEKCPQCGEALPSPLDKNGRCPECGTAIPPQPALPVAKTAKPRATKPPVDLNARNNGQGDRAKSRPPRSKRHSEGRDEGRPRNPYLTPLQFVSGAYFPF